MLLGGAWADVDKGDLHAVLREFNELNGSKYSDDSHVPDDKKDIEILLAYYNYEDYSGSTFVLFRQDGKLYEVNGGHCSCSGLEGQWSPEETSAEALRARTADGGLGLSFYHANEFQKELIEILDALYPLTSAELH